MRTGCSGPKNGPSGGYNTLSVVIIVEIMGYSVHFFSVENSAPAKKAGFSGFPGLPLVFLFSFFGGISACKKDPGNSLKLQDDNSG